jgi:ribosome maturation factor RimP
MDLQKLNALITQQVTALGFELVYMETAQDGCDPVIRLYVDCLDDDLAGGRLLTMKDCITINDTLVAWMDVAFPSLREDFVVEVSSPGLERPLVKFEHFRRFCGHMCRVQTKIPINGQKRFKGRIKKVTEESVILEEDGKIKIVYFEMIQKARLAPFDEENNLLHQSKTKVAVANQFEQASVEKSIGKEI